MSTSPELDRMELRAGTITRAEEFPEARKPSYKLTIDFGELGIKRSSAQITKLYSPGMLVNTQVIAMIGLPPKKIAGFVSECLVLGVEDQEGNVVLLRPDKPVANGSPIS